MAGIGQSNFLQALGWAVLNSLWQMAFLWVAYQLITAALRIKSPSQKTNLSAFLLFTGFGWFVFTLLAILIDESQSASQNNYTAFLQIEANTSVNDWLITTLPIASLAYLILLVFPVLQFIRSYRYVQVIRKHGLVKANVEWRIFTQKVGAHLGIIKPVQVWLSEHISSPVTIGYLKPVILLPVSAVTYLSAPQIEAILLHELAHIRRFDYLINLFTKIIQSILYFNPFVKAFAKIIETEREKTCDEMVMQFQYEPHSYASALLALEKTATVRTPLAVAAAGNRQYELLARIESILGIQKKNIFSFSKLAGVLAAVLCFIVLNALLLLSKPGKGKASSPDFMAQVVSPFFFIDENKTEVAAETTEPIINTPAQIAEEKKKLAADESQHAVKEMEVAAANNNRYKQSGAAAVSPYVNVSFKESLLPALSQLEEQQVKEAMDASKKIFEVVQWNQIEKEAIADALTLAEKSEVKQAYKKAAEKANWDKMADKLRAGYDQIDWNTINTSLEYTMAGIKLDSLKEVYVTALANLADLEKEMVKADQKSIPDTDITVAGIEKKKNEMLKAVNKIKAVRNKKIIHL